MPGKLCNGVAADQPYVNDSKAYCEGRGYATGGGAITQATGTTGVEVANTGLTWTAKAPGDGKRVVLADPGAIDAALSVQLVFGVLTVLLATDGAGDPSSTAAEVIAAVEADSAAAAFVGVVDTGASTGAGTVSAEEIILTGSSFPSMGYVQGEDFQRGFTSYQGGVGTVLPQDCCADPAYDGVP